MDEDRLKGTATALGGKIEGAFGSATGDAHTQMSGQAREAAGKIQDAFGQAKDTARAAADKVSDMSEDAIRQGAAYARSGKEVVNSVVSDRALVTLLLGAIGGYLLGLLMHGRR